MSDDDRDDDDLDAEYAGHVRSCAAQGIRPLTPDEFRVVWRTEDVPVPPAPVRTPGDEEDE